MSLRSIIRRHSKEHLVTRTTNPTPVNGIAQAGAVSTLKIQAVAQPVTGRFLQLLPEGLHADEARVLYTTTELFTVRSGGRPDRVTIDSEQYEVFRVDKHPQLSGGPHYVVMASRLALP